jgi:hypothetical protein
MEDKTENQTEDRMQDKIEQLAAEAVSIPSPYAKKWYDLGFLFAVNYLHAVLPAANEGTELNKSDFEEFVNGNFTHEDGGVIKADFFERYPFKQNGPINYPSGQCPGDIPNTCIPCTAGGVEPLP